MLNKFNNINSLAKRMHSGLMNKAIKGLAVGATAFALFGGANVAKNYVNVPHTSMNVHASSADSDVGDPANDEWVAKVTEESDLQAQMNGVEGDCSKVPNSRIVYESDSIGQHRPYFDISDISSKKLYHICYAIYNSPHFVRSHSARGKRIDAKFIKLFLHNNPRYLAKAGVLHMSHRHARRTHRSHKRTHRIRLSAKQRRQARRQIRKDRRALRTRRAKRHIKYRNGLNKDISKLQASLNNK